VDELTNKLGAVTDELAIRKLQHTYGYFRARRDVFSGRSLQGEGRRPAALRRNSAQ
jgi:hypothetical protein